MSKPGSLLNPWAFLALTPLVFSAVSLSDAISQAPDLSFVPNGGKNILLQIFGADSPDPQALGDISAMTKSEEEWLSYLKEKVPEEKDREAQTLAAYMSLVLPLPEGELAKAETAGDAAGAFPADGKELAIQNCQSCHSFFSGYLMQDRDLQGWRNIFLSPFHSEIKMTVKEREIFARYSAINMPLKYNDVPPEWRF